MSLLQEVHSLFKFDYFLCETFLNLLRALFVLCEFDPYHCQFMIYWITILNAWRQAYSISTYIVVGVWTSDLAVSRRLE